MGKLGLGLTALALAGATAVTCATISDKDKQNSELKESNTQLEITVDNQKDELLTKEVELEKLNKSFTAAKSDITNLQKEIATKDEELSDANKRIGDYILEVGGLRADYKMLSESAAAEKAELQNKITQKQSEIDTLSEEKSILENEKVTLQEKLDSIYSKVEELYSDWNMTLPEGTELAETRDAQIEQKANAIAAFIDAQSARISSLLQQLDTLPAENERLTNENAELKEELENMKANMPQLAIPTIALDSNRLKVTDSENGPFKGTYDLYKNGEYLDTVTTDSNGIAQIYMYGDGYTLTAKATYIGCKESDFTDELSIPTGCFNVAFNRVYLSVRNNAINWTASSAISGVVAKKYIYAITALNSSEIAKTGEVENTTSIDFSDTLFNELDAGIYQFRVKAAASAPFLEAPYSTFIYLKKSEDGTVTQATVDPIEISAEGRTITIESFGLQTNVSVRFFVYDAATNTRLNVTTFLRVGGTIDLSDYCADDAKLDVYIIASQSNQFAESAPSNTVTIKGPNYVEPTVQFDAPVITMEGTQAKWEHVTTNGTQCARYAYQIYSVDDSEIAKFSGTTFQNYLDLTSCSALPEGRYFVKIQCDTASGFTASEFSNYGYFEKYSSGLKAMLYAAEISAEGLRIKIEKNEGNFFDEYGYLVYFTSADPNEHETDVITSFKNVKAGDYLDLSRHIESTKAFKVYVVTFDSNNTYANSIPSNVVLLKGADYVEPTVQFDAPVLTMEGSQINWEHIFSGESQCSNYICKIYNTSDNKVSWSGPNISVNYLDINGTGLASRSGSYYIQIQCRSQVGIAASVLSNKIYFTINGVGTITQVQDDSPYSQFDE